MNGIVELQNDGENKQVKRGKVVIETTNGIVY